MTMLLGDVLVFAPVFLKKTVITRVVVALAPARCQGSGVVFLFFFFIFLASFVDGYKQMSDFLCVLHSN